MPLHILGLNHTTAPVELREQVVFTGVEIDRVLAAVTQLDGVTEAVVLSTCNRTEFFVETTASGQQLLRNWLHEDQGLDQPARDALFILDKEAAIQHLFRVACGLDSMVLGEPQILGQLKDAFRQSEKLGAAGQALSRLFRHTFSVAKKVRTDTDIGANPVSIAYAAVSLANQFFAGFSQHTALLIGAGVTIELVAKHLERKGIGRLFIANRDLARAQKLATQFDGFALPLSELEGTLPEADILISSTASSAHVVTVEQMSAAIRTRKHRPVFAVDIAVPRDLDPDIAHLDDVYLYTVDDLDKVVLEGQQSREIASVDARRILEDEARRYLSIERSKEVAPVITALRDHAEELRGQVLDQARRRLAKGADKDEVLDYATSALLKKLLHHPSVRLREAGEKSEKELIDAIRELFGLNQKN